MDNKKHYYKYFDLADVPKQFKDRQEVYNLFKKPKNEKHQESPHFYNFEENDTHQADTLFLPNDDGFAYALVVTDVSTGKTDAEPMELNNQTAWKGPSEEQAIEAIRTIYNRKGKHSILKPPNHLITDSGNEFGTKFQSFFQSKRINFKKALPGRHRQIAMVERKNQIIGRAIFMRMFSQEILKQKPSKEWVDDLPFIIKQMNEKYSHPPPTDESLYEKSDPVKNLKQNIIPLGTKVRVALDEPRNYKETKLSGRFRDTDQRWYQDIYKITGFNFDPHEPVMYTIDKPLKPNEHVAYTAQQLQIVPADEEDPPQSVLRKNAIHDQDSAIRELIDKRVVGNKTEYLVHWKGYPRAQADWIYKSKLPKSFVDKFEAEH